MVLNNGVVHTRVWSWIAAVIVLNNGVVHTRVWSWIAAVIVLNNGYICVCGYETSAMDSSCHNIRNCHSLKSGVLLLQSMKCPEAVYDI